MGWIWYRLGQVKTNRLVADDGSTDADVGGRDTSEDQSSAGCTPVAALPADGRGAPPNAMAHRWETSRPTVRRWRTGFNEAEPLGSILGTGYPRHRHEEWLKFLPVIDRDTSPGQAST